MVVAGDDAAAGDDVVAVVEPYRHEGVFIGKGKEDALVTKNLVPGEAVYNEKRISVLVPGARVMYLGAASGNTVSHVSDIVGPKWLGFGYMAKKRTNIIPIIEDARHPAKYRMLVGMVDVIFSDVAQPDQHIPCNGCLHLQLPLFCMSNSLRFSAVAFLGVTSLSLFLPSALCKEFSTECLIFPEAGGHFVISIKTIVPAEAVFAQEVKKLQADQFKPSEQFTLEPFERDHACVVGGYRMPKKQKDDA
ncbi:hypothetical protein HHK36_027684 [Tetracentron sinense]|uniref:Fibrillarin n=1 Tax=Tetracentron sinense TaxID=13715 RepID=A0A835D1G5_TETSI|nr:hypothetical protein HHK36_027684 [Tetracentron sinense]